MPDSHTVLFFFLNGTLYYFYIHVGQVINWSVSFQVIHKKWGVTIILKVVKKTNCVLRVTWINVLFKRTFISCHHTLCVIITAIGFNSHSYWFQFSSNFFLKKNKILKQCETFLYCQTAWLRHHFSIVLSLYELLGFVLS